MDQYAALAHGLPPYGHPPAPPGRPGPDAPHGPTPERLGRDAWNWLLFDFALRLALLYPVLSLVLVWGVLGGTFSLGSTVLLEAAPPVGRLLELLALSLTAGICGIAAWLARRAWRAPTLMQRWAFIVAAVIVLGGLPSLAAPEGLGHGPFILSGLAGLMFGAGIHLGRAADRRRGVLSVSLRVGQAILLYLAGMLGLTLAGAVLVTGAVALGVGGAAVRTLYWMTRRTAYGLSGYAGLVLALILLLIVLGRAIELDEELASLIVFLVLLPLVNALFDFLSFGLTRFLVRRGVRLGGVRAWRMGLVDVVSAVVLFAGLGMAMIAVVHWASPPGATPLVDLPALFANIRTDWAAHLWPYICLFSTLLHLLLGTVSGALALIMPRFLSNRLIDDLAKPDPDAVTLNDVATAMAATCVLAVMAFAASAGSSSGCSSTSRPRSGRAISGCWKITSYGSVPCLELAWLPLNRRYGRNGWDDDKLAQRRQWNGFVTYE